ncbi:MAG: GyrI-like domain-containing protein [Anaerolineales bacterium]|nr:GyrI-like domain-containing protein [Anaerolineales bacterium]
MKKLNLKKQLAAFYKASAKKVDEVEIPSQAFLMIDGKGNPNTAPEYAEAVTALYQLSYAIKFHIKKGETAIDYAVMPLEGLWWADDMRLFTVEDKSAWRWTMMILQPDFVTRGIVETVRAEVAGKKNPPALPKVRFEAYKEGPAAQSLHIGPYAAEGPTVIKIHEHIKQSGRSLRGKHHEIYLKDPRKSAPEKLQTIIRQPYA